MLTKEKETSYLDKGFVHSLNVFFLFVSLSLALSHVGDFTVLCTSKKRESETVLGITELTR